MLTASDVSQPQGRLLIPRKDAETCFFPSGSSFPREEMPLELIDGKNKRWYVKLRYYESSKSYVIREDWTKFLIHHPNLEKGDVVELYKLNDQSHNHYFIRCTKAEQANDQINKQVEPEEPSNGDDDLTGDNESEEEKLYQFMMGLPNLEEGDVLERYKPNDESHNHYFIWCKKAEQANDQSNKQGEPEGPSNGDDNLTGDNELEEEDTSVAFDIRDQYQSGTDEGDILVDEHNDEGKPKKWEDNKDKACTVTENEQGEKLGGPKNRKSHKGKGAVSGSNNEQGDDQVQASTGKRKYEYVDGEDEKSAKVESNSGYQYVYDNGVKMMLLNVSKSDEGKPKKR